MDELELDLDGESVKVEMTSTRITHMDGTDVDPAELNQFLDEMLADSARENELVRLAIETGQPQWMWRGTPDNGITLLIVPGGPDAAEYGVTVYQCEGHVHPEEWGGRG